MKYSDFESVEIKIPGASPPPPPERGISITGLIYTPQTAGN